MNRSLPVQLPLEAIANLCREYRVSELFIFGSALRPGFGGNSDIDLLVVFEPSASIGYEFVRLQTALSEVMGRKVDLVPKEALKPLVRDEILSEARLIYAAGAPLPQ